MVHGCVGWSHAKEIPKATRNLVRIIGGVAVWWSVLIGVMLFRAKMPLILSSPFSLGSFTAPLLCLLWSLMAYVVFRYRVFNEYFTRLLKTTLGIPAQQAPQEGEAKKKDGE